MSRILLSSLVLVLIVNAITAALVPKVYLETLQLEPVNGQKYKIRILHSDGSALEEVVEKTQPGRYEVRGHLDQPQFKPLGKLLVTSENVENGNNRVYQYLAPEDLSQSKLVLLDEPLDNITETV